MTTVDTAKDWNVVTMVFTVSGPVVTFLVSDGPLHAVATAPQSTTVRSGPSRK